MLVLIKEGNVMFMGKSIIEEVQIIWSILMSTIIKYIIIILIALVVGWNIRISINESCDDNICEPPQEYNERGDEK